MKNKSTLATSLIKKIKPANYKKIISYKGNLIEDGLLEDPFDIIKICSEIETISKKKIPLKKIKEKTLRI